MSYLIYLLDISWFDDLGKCWMAEHSCYISLSCKVLLDRLWQPALLFSFSMRDIDSNFSQDFSSDCHVRSPVPFFRLQGSESVPVNVSLTQNSESIANT